MWLITTPICQSFHTLSIKILKLDFADVP